MMADNTFDIQGGSNQILPNAQEARQQIFIGDSAIRLAGASEGDTVEGKVLDMTSFSSTFPECVDNELWREIHLSICEEKLLHGKVLCLTGEKGVGMTTFLSQFSRSHATNCVSYYYNGFDRIRLHAEVMERDITEQLYWFATQCSCPSDVTHISDVYSKVMKRLRQTKGGMIYFVFDGFDDIPAEYLENIRKLMVSLQWEKAHFLFSGKKEKIETLFNTTAKWSVDEVPLLRFSEADANEYFRRSHPDISAEHLHQLYKISRGNASRMNDLRTKFLDKARIEDLMIDDIDGNSDLNQEDFSTICADSHPATIPLFTLLSYIEVDCDIPFAAQVLQITIEDAQTLVNRYSEYITLKDDGNIRLRTETFRKYLCERLVDHRRDVSLRLIRVLEDMPTDSRYSVALPALYKSMGLNDELIRHLSADNIQRILAEGHSQASLNVQCGFGYEACAVHAERHKQDIFRFSLHRAASREIERNALWDYEISALLSLGQHAKALALAQTVYLSEERLKCLLLIAQKPGGLSPDDQAVLKDTIRQLVKEIRFEDIPDKSMELAKLLLPIDYKAAIDIVDRVAKSHKENVNTDRIFSQFSLFDPIDLEDDEARRDLARSKIQNTTLRELVDATKTLFSKDDVETFLEAIKCLPNYAQQLQLLCYWLPAHKEKEGIGKAVLEALRLIVADSDMEMPKARVLSVVARLIDTMSREQMEEGLRYVNSLGDTIMHPTPDYVDAMISVIEGSRKVLPEKSQTLLEALYVFVDDLKDRGMWLTCRAKLLGHFDTLGNNSLVSETIGTKEVLRRDLKEKAWHLLSSTAYHIKVIEGSIAALVCTEPEMIDTLIVHVNTAERRSRAYSYAAEQYLLHVDPKRLDLDYFFQLLSKADANWGDCWKPLDLLASKLVSREKLLHEQLLPSLKAHIGELDRLEDVWQLCTISLRLYTWADRHFPDDPFAEDIKRKLLSWWESINQRQDKIVIGFQIAKSVARRSRVEAEQMIARCSELRQRGLLSSSSCVKAFFNSHELYVDSLITLISRGLCDERTLQTFKEDESDLVSESEQACMWGKIALAYHLAGNDVKLRELGDRFLPADYSCFTRDEQKWLIFHISPVLFLRGQQKFFTLLDDYDEVFRDACLKRVCILVISKKLDIMELDVKTTYELTYSDFNDLNTLLSYMTDDNLIFETVEVLARSLKFSNKKQAPLSTQQKRAVIGTTAAIVEKKLPALGGISHDGYKIACQAILNYASANFQTAEKSKWEERVKTVRNKADRAFLYFYMAPFFAKNSDKEYFLHKGIEVTADVHFTFDRVSRLGMAFTECAVNKLSHLLPKVAEEALASLRSDGTQEQYENLLDTVHQYKPELAEDIMVRLDQDPARVYNKRKLQNHLDSVKRLAKAGKDVTVLDQLSHEEQRKFFEDRLKNLLIGKGQVEDVDATFALTIRYMYENVLSDTMPAVHYLMETVSQRQKISKNCRDILLGLHLAIRHNLIVVLSLASGTKERMERVNAKFSNVPDMPDNFVGLGEHQKAVDYLLRWYLECGYGELTIIDPYFRPSDLSVIKQLADENNDLSIRILTHKNTHTVEDFTSEWRKVSAGVKTPVSVTLVSYTTKPAEGPLHDRYWVCVDEETDQRHGLTLGSVGGMGQKEGSIQSIEDATALYALHSYTRYAIKRIGKVGEFEMQYDTFTLE